MVYSTRKSNKEDNITWPKIKLWGARCIVTTIFAVGIAVGSNFINFLLSMNKDIVDLKASEPITNVKMQSIEKKLDNIEKKVDDIHWFLTKGSTSP